VKAELLSGQMDAEMGSSGAFELPYSS